MENNNTSTTPTVNTQFVLSYELLLLLQWMIENDAPRLKKIIAKAMRSGLRNELQRVDVQHEEQMLEHAQHSVVDFFSLLEGLMVETINEQAVEMAMEKELMPTIDQIDGAACDDDTIRASVERATAQLGLNPHENPHDMLFKELLKQWKPSKKTAVN